MTHPYQTTTKAAFAADAAAQLRYILMALGIEDDHDAITAILAALQGGSSRKRAAQATAETLRKIKLATRKLAFDVEAGHESTRYWFHEAARLQVDKETIAKDADYWQTRAQAAETKTEAAETKIEAAETKTEAADDAQRARDRKRVSRGDPVPTTPIWSYCTTCWGTDRLSDGDEGSYCAHCGGTTTTTKENRGNNHNHKA